MDLPAERIMYAQGDQTGITRQGAGYGEPPASIVIGDRPQFVRIVGWLGDGRGKLASANAQRIDDIVYRLGVAIVARASYSRNHATAR